MQVQSRRNGLALVLFILGFVIVGTLALANTTWASPNAQGTVPTPPNPTGQPTSTGGGNNGGGDNGGGQTDSGGQNNSGGQTDSGSTGTAPATVPSPGAGSVCAIGDSGAQCTIEDLIIVVGAGTAPSGSALTIEGPFGQPPCPASPEGNVFLNRCYRFGWIDNSAQPLAEVNGPVQYCMNFGAEQVAAADNKPDAMLIAFAGADGKWTVVKPTVDTAANRACATTNQEIVWSALFAPKAASALLPTVGGENNAWWMLSLAVVGGVMMLAAVRIARKGRA